MPERVIVAMSGGVDSSVAAALLVEQGYEVIGVMLRLWSEPVQPTLGSRTVEAATNRCCSVESIHDARGVADRLGIPFYVINVEQPFKENVVDFFVREYAAGRTPNPCLVCNRTIRFGHLLNHARSLGASYLATGHYARIRRGADGGYQLWRGADRAKDQSYVLSVLGQADLAQALFPVGEYTKPQVRALAAAAGCRPRPGLTARICASWRMGITGGSCPIRRPRRFGLAPSLTARGGSWAVTAGCRSTRSANAAGWGSPRRSLSTCWRWIRSTTH